MRRQPSIGTQTDESKATLHHTMASLFNLLYGYLIEDKQIISLTNPSQLDELRTGATSRGNG